MSQVLSEEKLAGGQLLQMVQGDLTQENVDAIVNAANSELAHGAGVAGVISRRAGSQVQEESFEWVRKHGAVSHDAPAYTHAGNLPCRYVIHAVGPVWGSGDEDQKLTTAVQGSLQLADKLGLGSLALPAISTGIFGFPRLRAARVILAAIRNYYQSRPDSKVSLVRISLVDVETIQAFQSAWQSRDQLQS